VAELEVPQLGKGAAATGGVNRTTRVVMTWVPVFLVTGRIRLHHVPVEDGEDFIKARVTPQIGAVELEMLPSR